MGWKPSGRNKNWRVFIFADQVLWNVILADLGSVDLRSWDVYEHLSWLAIYMGVEPKIGGFYPQNGWFIRENPIKNGRFGETPIFWKHPYTLLETNGKLAPENGWLEDDPFLFRWVETKSLEPSVTLPETNIAPETLGLEDEFPFRMAYFQGRLLLVSGRVYFCWSKIFSP